MYAAEIWFKYINLPSYSAGSKLEVQFACFNEFPDQCVGCPEYGETRLDQATQLSLLSGIGMMYPSYTAKVVKECKRFHKRKVEYMR